MTPPEDVFRQALSSIPQGAILSDAALPDNPIVWANAAFTQLTGYAREEVLGRNCRFLQGEGTDPATVEELRRAVAARRGCLVEILNYRKDGSEFWNSLSLAPVNPGESGDAEVGGGGGEGRYFVGIQTDVTRFKRAETQVRHERNLEAVGRMTGAIAHDLNNLLTVMLGYGEVFQHSPDLPESLRGLAVESLRATRGAVGVTSGLLKVLYRKTPTARAVHLDECVASAGPLVGMLVGPAVAVALDLAAPGRWVRIDADNLTNVLFNLAANARDAMPAGGRLTIATAAARSGAGARVLQLRVTDTGGGIDAAIVERVFDPYFSTKPRGQGLGIGLASVREFAEESSGTVRVETVKGQGTTIVIELPEVATPSQPFIDLPAAPGRPSTGRVLVAEDNEAIAAVLQAQLEIAGLEAVVVADGDEAIAALAHPGAAYDVLLTDLTMGETSGREVARWAAEHRPDTEVFLMTGRADAVEDFPEDRVVSKPFSGAELVARIRALVDAKKAAGRGE